MAVKLKASALPDAPKQSRWERRHGGIPDSIKHFDELPDSAFVRLPTVSALHDISSATTWRWVKAGRLPAPHRLSPGVSAWNVGELRRARASV